MYKDPVKQLEYNREYGRKWRAKNPEYNHQWREKNRDERNRWAREYRKKPNRKIKVNEYVRTKNKNFRLKVLSCLGNKCKRCGFSDRRALQIDHLNGGGVKEKKLLGEYRMYKQVMNDTSNKYQLLCANCNWIKRYENNEFRSGRCY